MIAAQDSHFRKQFGAFLMALPALLAALGLLAWWYAGVRGIPYEALLVLLPSFLLEAALYFSAANAGVRERLESMPKATLASWMTASAVPAYALYTIPAGLFDWRQILAIVALTAVASFWHVVLPRRAVTDLLFVVFMATPVLFDTFRLLYPTVSERAPAFYLGLILWYRTGIIELLCIREMKGIGFGFLPSRADWKIGLRYFAFFLPVGVALAVAIGFGELRDLEFSGKVVLNAVLVFLGILWVVAVAEEFFFRGVLQQIFVALFRSEAAGLLVASVLFGLVHLGFRNQFPNWRMAALAAVAGIFYGMAYRDARSIRAAMVTHALTVTTWRVFLT